MRVSLITTVLNEEKTIDVFLDSVAAQTKKPDEVIVVDGGSVDWTIDKLQRRGVSDINLKIMSEPGANRSQGRNAGVKIATGEIVAITDAGCVLDKDWLSEMAKGINQRASIGMCACKIYLIGHEGVLENTVN